MASTIYGIYLAQNTPGPWRVEKGNIGEAHPLFVVAPGKDGLRPWCDADAHLIASAIELYEALLDVRPSCRGSLCWCERSWDVSEGHTFACERARAAIAKAVGKPIIGDGRK